MTPEEIRNLIARKIAGQGTQVDVGGALPEILNAILEKAEEGGGGEAVILQVLMDEDNGYLTDESRQVFATLKEKGPAAIMAATLQIPAQTGNYFAIKNYSPATGDIVCDYNNQELIILTI